MLTNVCCYHLLKVYMLIRVLTNISIVVHINVNMYIMNFTAKHRVTSPSPTRTKECRLVAGEVPPPFNPLSTAQVPFSMAPNPQLLRAPDYMYVCAAPSL